MKPIKIARLDDTGNWKVLASFSTYEKADLALDKYSEKYPNAWVDILDGALTFASPVSWTFRIIMQTITGTLVNPSNPNDIREVKFTSVYGGWRDDSEGSKTYGRIRSEALMQQILAQYPTLKVTHL